MLLALLDVSEGVRISAEPQKHLSLESQAFLFRFDAGPGVGVRLLVAEAILCLMVELGVIGVVRNGARIPDYGMAPSTLADHKSWFSRSRLHAATLALSD